MTNDTKIKSRFVKNRLKEIKLAKSAFVEKYNIPFYYNYVSSTENPADLITRTNSSTKFKKNLKLWLNGLEWLSNEFKNWSQNQLLSISPEVKDLTLVNTYVNETTELKQDNILDLNKYSSLHKLMRVTSYIFKFYSKCKKIDIDCNELAQKYWILHMQKECFFKRD